MNQIHSLIPTLNNFSIDSLFVFLKAIILLFIGYISAKISSKTISKGITKFISTNQTYLFHQIIFYSIFILFIVMALQTLGFKLNTLLGAAGILTVALGFASQTSVSNIISGLFLIAEKPFVIGDSIKVNDTTGEVLSIDLLSTKIRTFDNTLVRLPNEILIKSNIINLTRYPVRRFDLAFTVDYKEDLEKIKNIIMQVAEQNNLCLKEPKPFLEIMGFGTSGIDLHFLLWTSTHRLADFKNSIYQQIQKAFEQHHIEMPSQQINLAAADNLAFPIKLINSPENTHQ